MWHEKEPCLEEIKKAMDEFDFTGYTELVYCGYGEPTCALESLIASAAYASSVVDVLSEEEITASLKLADELGIQLRVRKYA